MVLQSAHIDSGDTAWVLLCAALVLLMTPGLAFFYAGMVRAKNVLGMLMQNFITIGIVTVTWVVVGYSLAFGPDVGAGVLGGLDLVGRGHEAAVAADADDGAGVGRAADVFGGVEAELDVGTVLG